jgi:opacity protein-like surface antigen
VDVEGVGTSAYGLNLYGVFKQPLSDNLKLFAKAGVNYTVVEGSIQLFGVNFTEAQSKFGVGGGFGGEYALTEKLSLLLGATVKLIFAEETGTWFKIYGGVSYRLN